MDGGARDAMGAAGSGNRKWEMGNGAGEVPGSRFPFPISGCLLSACYIRLTTPAACYGQLVVKVLSTLTITTPRAVAPTRTMRPLRNADLMGPMIGSRTGMVLTRW